MLQSPKCWLLQYQRKIQYIYSTYRIIVHGPSGRLHASYQLFGLDNNFWNTGAMFLILKQTIKQTNSKTDIRLNIERKCCASCITSRAMEYAVLRYSRVFSGHAHGSIKYVQCSKSICANFIYEAFRHFENP